MARVIFDIETNGLTEDLDTIHSIVIKDIDHDVVWSCNDQFGHVNDIQFGLDMLMNADQIIGHNIIKFDIPAIQKVYPWFEIDEGKVFDTLVASRLIWPEIREQDGALWAKQQAAHKRRVEQHQKFSSSFATVETERPDPVYTGFPGQLIGRHGLEAWGHRLGLHKGDYAKEMKAQGLDPWAQWSPEMQVYCENDVEVTHALLKKIESKNYSPQALELEHQFQWVIWRQEQFGFPFDMKKARKLEQELMALKAQLEAELQEAFPPWINKTEFTPKRDNKTKGYKKGVTILKEKEVVFNPGSRDHIALVLKKKYGWVPTEWTKGSSKERPRPKVDETVLEKLDYPEAALLVRYLLVSKRLGQLSEGAQSWFRNVRMDAHYGDPKIHGQVVTNGAVTGRCTHQKPNMGQVPSVQLGGDKTPLKGEAGGWGYECRELFYAPEGFLLVGADASGLELRCLAHFMAQWDGGAYGKILLEGDIHTANQEAAGLPTRAMAKTFIYAYLYGAGDEKIGSIVEPTAGPERKRKIGRELKARFLKKIPALKELKTAVTRAVQKRGFLKGLDKRHLHIRSEHAALNTLLQSAGALAVKQATVIFDQEMRANGYKWGEDYALVAHIHDEFQVVARKGLENIAADTARKSFRDAGDHFGFKCPLDGEARIGSNWAETH